MKNYLIAIFCLIVSIQLALCQEDLCSSSLAQQSCGQCIKAHSECAWCIDPHSTLSKRCQLKSKFTNETCTSHLVYSPQTAQVKVQQNIPLESFHHDGKTVVRLQPQSTSVRLMPGHKATVSFKYLHQSDPNRRSAEPEKMEIQTSDIRDTPLKLKFFIDCNGEKQETKSCPVKDKQIVEFQVEVSVDSCSSTGDITLSIGVLGQRTITGLYVTTICGCECEKHPEMNSRLCHQNGHLVCGQCICDQSRGGDKCECPLATYGVSTAAQLDDKCRFNLSSSICSDNGRCKCGQCECSQATITGKFCQCDNDSCPKSADGKICSGNGVCDCGVCKCEMGWERDDCSCSTESNNCVENGEMCLNSGHCECNRCVCNIEKIGAFCGSDYKVADDKNKEKNKELSEVVEEAGKTVEETDAPLPSDAELDKELTDSVTSSGIASQCHFIVFIIFVFILLGH